MISFYNRSINLIVWDQIKVKYVCCYVNINNVFLNNVCYYGFYRNMYLVTEIYFKFIS